MMEQAMRPACLVCVMAAVLLSGGSHAQSAGSAVALSGLNGQKAALSRAELDALPQVTLSVVQHDKQHVYEGALLTDVLAKVGAPRGAAIHGADLADVVFIEARDGYKVALGLAETDAVTRKDRIILADRIDGAPLDAKQGPFKSLSRATCGRCVRHEWSPRSH